MANEDLAYDNYCKDTKLKTLSQLEKKCRKTKKFIKKGLHLLNKNYNNSNAECHEDEFCLSEDSRIIFIVNGGLTTGADNAAILELFLSCGFKEVEDVITIPGKQYSFVVLSESRLALKAVKTLSGIKCLPHSFSPLYMDCINKVPFVKHAVKYSLPPGLIVIENFISKDEENMLSSLILWDQKPSTVAVGSTLKHREVRHFGYEFSYSSNNVDKLSPLERLIPVELMPICNRIVEKGLMKELPDQLTVNRYLPGQGIPPHVDTHSAFSEEIVSLSTLGSVSMEFKYEKLNENGGCISDENCFDSSYHSVYLPARSLCVMTGPSRYLFSHGISSRKTDIVPLENNSKNLALCRRGERISFTFRKIRTGECTCTYPSTCDSQNYGKDSSHNSVKDQHTNPKSSLDLERDHVLNVYEEIAEHFDQTRHKPWPKVLQFVQSLPLGSLMLDIGTGNGKYLSGNSQIYSIGIDNCRKLVNICSEKRFAACLGSCLTLPFRSNAFDAVICIAVIHHLSSQERREKAISELARVLNENGVGLVYVWAMEQRKGKCLSAYLKQNKANRVKNKNSPESQNHEDTKINLNAKANSGNNDEKNADRFLIHENRTDFMEQDMLVPWKRKNFSAKSENTNAVESVYHRYYHVFKEGELENLISSCPLIKILTSYYDEGNWCVSFQKVCKS